MEEEIHLGKYKSTWSDHSTIDSDQFYIFNYLSLIYTKSEHYHKAEEHEPNKNFELQLKQTKVFHPIHQIYNQDDNIKFSWFYQQIFVLKNFTANILVTSLQRPNSLKFLYLITMI